MVELTIYERGGIDNALRVLNDFFFCFSFEPLIRYTQVRFAIVCLLSILIQVSRRKYCVWIIKKIQVDLALKKKKKKKTQKQRNWCFSLVIKNNTNGTNVIYSNLYQCIYVRVSVYVLYPLWLCNIFLFSDI